MAVIRVRVGLGLALVLGIAGCDSSRDYFPLEVGKTWTYTVRSDMATFVEDVKVTGRVPIDSVEGYRLSGPLGVSRLAWKKGRLITDMLPNTRISPPLTLLAPNMKQPISWSGFVEILGTSRDAKATLTQKAERLQLGSRKYDTIKATVVLTTAGKEIVLDTWYSPDMGPLRQEQRTNGVLNLASEYLGRS